MSPILLSIVGLSTLALLPVSMSDSESSTNSTNTCGSKITQLENQIQIAVDSSKTIHFIESNTTAFKSLNQKYTLYWVNTKYSWNTDVSTCSAHLEGITASYQISNSTLPFMGMAHITVDPALTKIIDFKVDIPNAVTSHK